VKREAFERAIHSDEPAQQSIADQIDIGAIPVEDSYKGPRITWPLTHEKGLEIAQALKDTERLHRRCAAVALRLVAHAHEPRVCGCVIP
jgi:hypothetical protein